MPRKNAATSEVRISASEEAEAAVTKYLATLGTPKPRGRRARPKPDFDQATKGITDPLARLAAIKAERERVANLTVDDTDEADFVKYAKVWARIHDYNRDDFAVLGVTKRVLDAAFGTRSARAAAAPAVTPKRTRAPRTDARTLADAIEAKPAGTWLSIADVMQEIGGSSVTVRKVLDELSAAGTLTRPINDPYHTGRGRAPKVWQRN